MYNGNYFNIERLNRMKDDIDSQIKAYQSINQAPINNYFSQPKDDTYLLKILNDNDEVENILINHDTIFLGGNRMQIKKLDGTIEKYTIEKYYPIDEKDQMIKELNKKVEELERKLNNEHTKHNVSTKKCNKPNANDDEHIEPESKAIGESVSNEE